GRQRWMCQGCRTTGAVRDLSRRRRAELAEFLGWLLAPSPQPSGSRAFRKRTSWCWGLRPVLEPDAAARHVVMADGMYLKGGGCLLIVIDGLSGEVIAWQWCVRESTDEYTALFSRIPAPDVLVCDGLRGIEKACRRAWPGTRIQRCLVHVQRDSRRDLTSRPRLQAGRELKRLADTITGIHDTEQAAAWAVQLHEWHNRWRDMLAERTYAKDAPGDPPRHRTGMVVDAPAPATLLSQAGIAARIGIPVRIPRSRTRIRRPRSVHHQPPRGRNQRADQTHARQSPRPSRTTPRPRMRMGMLHEERQAGPLPLRHTG
ncbi:transposase, partial [Bifidobacterium boum]